MSKPTLMALRRPRPEARAAQQCRSHPATKIFRALPLPASTSTRLVFSCEVGLEKPDPAIYERARSNNSARARTGSCLFIGDGGSRELTACAQHVGMQAALIRVDAEIELPRVGSKTRAEWSGPTIGTISERPRAARRERLKADFLLVPAGTVGRATLRACPMPSRSPAARLDRSSNQRRDAAVGSTVTSATTSTRYLPVWRLNPLVKTGDAALAGVGEARAVRRREPRAAADAAGCRSPASPISRSTSHR